MNDLDISVIIPSYDINKLNLLKKSIDSVLSQKYSNYDIIVITESEDLTDAVESSYNSSPRVSVVQISNESGGVSEARNEGIKQARGDIIAYIDSDAVADENWLQKINKVYQENEDVIAVGGKSIANWETNKPWYLPDSFLWLVGVTHKGHPDHGEIIRSTFGCNMTFKKNIFDKISGFSSDLGKSHGFNLQGEEPELGLRIQNEFNTGMYYTKNAIIYHTVEKHQTNFKWLSKRAYLQGVTKAIMSNKKSELQTEENYLRKLFLLYVPKHIKSLISGKSIVQSIGSIIGIIWFTFLVGLGFLRGKLSTFFK